VNRITRSWTDNGIRYNNETTSYSSPGMMFEMSSTSTSGARTQRSQGPGIIGAAFNVFGNVLAAKQQAAQEQQRRRSMRQPYVDDMAYGEDEYEEPNNGQRKPRGIIGAFAEKLLSTQQQRQRRVQRGDDERGARQESGRSRGYERPSMRRGQEQRASYNSGRQSYVDEYSDEEDEEDESDYDIPNERRPRRAFTADDASIIKELEKAAEHHRREMRRCQKELETTSRLSNVRSSVLQRLVNELKSHENAHRNATESLEMAKAGAGSGGPRPRAHFQQRPRRADRTPSHDYDDIFEDDEPHSFFQPRRNATAYVEVDDIYNAGPFNNPFAAFDHILHNIHFGHELPFQNGVFGIPRATYTFGNQPGAQPRASARSAYQQPTASPAPPAGPPATLLRPDEAKRLFKTYNERWTSIPLIDSNIPYPTRTLKASALGLRDTIWAPNVTSPISTWSNELVMQANAQAFFLGVVDLSPDYNDASPSGRIVMGYDKKRASAVQVKALVDVLKKEKSRWHSDRLGRRNGGAAGPNEGLQSDERARAVFHAVCELMEFAVN